MSALDRRTLLRVVAPAVAMPMLAGGAAAREARLVSRDEIMEAYRFFDHMELAAEDLNLRYQILIDLLFETNPDNLRSKLQQLRDNRSKRSVLVDADTGQIAPYDPSMYDADGNLLSDSPGQERVVQFRDVDASPQALPPLPPPRWHKRVARFVRRQVIGI